MKFFFTILIPFIFSTSAFPQGSVFMVLGSDTGIWDGMDVGKYECTYNLSLFTNSAMNAALVMDPAFREQFKDSYGQTMKMTWWLMAGNLFRYATNNNVPIPNSMIFYLMRKHHGKNVQINGDEVSLHYHTFTWTDYNQDKLYFWNQAQNINDFREDFDFTLAQVLLDEEIFPVSFRSGWHFMDNDWQRYIDRLMPYSLHNDYPSKRTSIQEPIDNVYDWSQASREYVPFHPSLDNYQIPGNGKSWNTRSKFMGNVTQAEMDSIFIKAKNGIDQVPCFWAHLPETDFARNMKRIDSLAHISAAKFPSVKFSYCTAVEAMQQWRKGTDDTPPVVTITEAAAGEFVFFVIQTNEPIFQSAPFVAVRTVTGDYSAVTMIPNGADKWISVKSYLRTSLSKVATAVTDTMGNLGTAFLTFEPDDLFLDNRDPGYLEMRGSWKSNQLSAWGTDSRQCTLGPADTAAVQWQPLIPETRPYSLFIQIPPVNNAVTRMKVTIYSPVSGLDTVMLNGPFAGNAWIYLSTATLARGNDNTIEVAAYGSDQAGKVLTADVLKLSARILERKIAVKENIITPPPISEDDSVSYPLWIENRGVADLTINNIYSVNGVAGITTHMPVVISGMGKRSIPLWFYSHAAGTYGDTLIIASDDAEEPVLTIPLEISVEPYFSIVDNEDSLSYAESGPWAYSVAQRWGSSSRYAPSGKGAVATFTTHLKKSGIYEIFEIVPTTLNAVSNALYTVINGTDTIGSAELDQNIGSGNWISLGQHPFTNTKPAIVTVRDKGPASSFVLRADAIKFQIITPATIRNSVNGPGPELLLDQNYPNPFNPVTTIRFYLPRQTTVHLAVYDMLGRLVETMLHEEMNTGTHSVFFDGSRLSSGLYAYRITAGSSSLIKKMLLIK